MRGLVCLAAVAALAGAPALAQPPRPAANTPPAPATRNPLAAPAGTYALSRNHVGLIVKVQHSGFSYSIFRMNTVSGSLTWDPARPEASKVTATIAANSLSTNVAGFAETLSGPIWLDAATYPTITFTSTAIRRTGPTTGVVTGDLTLHGVTKPVALQVEMTGAGQGVQTPAIGFSATGVVRRSDFGAGPASMVVGDEMAINIDLEFNKVPG
ncbi:MAG TPA: YceI family protein [Caulobacteraceae bacterium]|jgi:polyisoprenoid-binding protein YceI|nr:YceI family protein [Caulobacteraceae bacterium]